MDQGSYNALTEKFPTCIPLCNIDRPYNTGAADLTKVQAPDDLLSRFLFGDLVFESFHHDGKQWSAEYRHPDDLGHFLITVSNENRFQLQGEFLGVPFCAAGPARSFDDITRWIAASKRKAYDNALKAHLEQRYNLTVVPDDGQLVTSIYVPDGYLSTLLVPIPIWQLKEVTAFHESLRGDRSVHTTIDAAIGLQVSVVNYVDGRVPEELSDTVQLVAHQLQRIGTPLIGLPIHEVAQDGSSAWTVRRHAYLYICWCFMREVPSLVEKLARAGFIATAEELQQDRNPVLPELRAALISADQMLAVPYHSWWSVDKSRRMTWGNFDSVEFFDRLWPATAEATRFALSRAEEACGSLMERSRSASE